MIAVALIGGAVAPSTSESQATPALEAFDGTWALSSGEANLRGALDGVADQLNLLIREIARLELRRRITPERQVRFIVESERYLALSWDDWGPHRMEIGGPARRMAGPDGQRIAVRLTLRNGQIVHHHSADNGARYTTYSLSRDERRMTMAVRITSDQLPVDIRYRLQYRRR